MEAASDEACLPAMRDLCLQLLANVTRVQVNERVAYLSTFVWCGVSWLLLCRVRCVLGFGRGLLRGWVLCVAFRVVLCRICCVLL